MNDIHAIIAAAKYSSVKGRATLWQWDEANGILAKHAIATAEALTRADALLAQGRYADAAMVIGDCLDKIVKEVQ